MDIEKMEREAAALVILVRYGVEPDVQELLVNGDQGRGIRPGALRAAIEAALPAQEWQDISTAPKDGKTVYGENWKTGQRGLVHLNDHGEWEIVDGMSNLPTGIGFYPTHWQPLPASPPYPAQPAPLIADDRGT